MSRKVNTTTSAAVGDFTSMARGMFSIDDSHPNFRQLPALYSQQLIKEIILKSETDKYLNF